MEDFSSSITKVLDIGRRESDIRRETLKDLSNLFKSTGKMTKGK